jgi:hypothetical protein
MTAVVAINSAPTTRARNAGVAASFMKIRPQLLRRK